MKKTKIYFAGSIRGGREYVEYYKRIIEHLKNYGEVLTEHIGETDLSTDGEDGLTDKFIHQRDLDWLLSADVLVAEVSNPSLGVGYEIGRSVENNIKILCLYQIQPDKKLSGMISGCPDVIVKEYKNFEDVVKVIDEYFKTKEI